MKHSNAMVQAHTQAKKLIVQL